jgi:ankyrin repeat protein
MSQALKPQQTNEEKKGASKSKKAAAALAKLIESIRAGDMPSFTAILQPGFKFTLNDAGPDGNTPLGLACQLGHGEMITVLVTAEAKINQVDSEGISPLGHACKLGRKDAVEILLALRADPNFHTTFTPSPISMATTGGHLDVVKRLVDAKADVNPSGDNPLYLACKGNYLPLVEYLLAKDATIPDGGSKKHFSRKVNELLASAGLTASAKIIHSSSGQHTHFHPKTTSELLKEYIETGNTAQVKSILQKADINARWEGRTPLDCACREGHLEIIEALVAAKAEVNTTNKKSETPLFFALEAKRNASQAGTFLLSQKADVNHQRDDGASPLCRAAYWGNVEIIALLLAAKADHEIVMTKEKGAFPVWLAAQGGHAEAIRVLAAAGANLNRVDHVGISALWAASQNGHENAVETLLALKADPNVYASPACPPISVAAENGHIEVVKMLVAAKAEVNIDSEDNPLYLAHMSNNKPLIRYLIENGADVAMCDRIMRSTTSAPAVNEFTDVAPVNTPGEDAASETDSSIKGGPTSQQDILHSSSRSILLAQPPASLALESPVLTDSLSEESAKPVFQEDSTATPVAKIR